MSEKLLLEEFDGFVKYAMRALPYTDAQMNLAGRAEHFRIKLKEHFCDRAKAPRRRLARPTDMTLMNAGQLAQACKAVPPDTSIVIITPGMTDDMQWQASHAEVRQEETCADLFSMASSAPVVPLRPRYALFLFGYEPKDSYL